MAANAAKFSLHKTDSISLTCSELIHAFMLVYLAIVKCPSSAIHIQAGQLWGSLQHLSILAFKKVFFFNFFSIILNYHRSNLYISLLIHYTAIMLMVRNIHIFDKEKKKCHMKMYSFHRNKKRHLMGSWTSFSKSHRQILMAENTIRWKLLSDPHRICL